MFLKTLCLLFALSCTALVSNAAPSGARERKVVAGTDYQVLASGKKSMAAKNGKVEVIEFFYFGCQACMRMDPALQAWAKRNSAFVSVRRIPVVFSHRLEGHAFLYGALEHLKLEALATPAVFEEVLVNRNYLLTSRSQSEFVKRFGVSDDVFQKALQASQTTAAVAEYARLANQYKIEAVPAVVFNGNELVTVGTTPERTAEVLDYLLSKSKRGGR